MRGFRPRKIFLSLFSMTLVAAGVVLFASAGASADPGPGYSTSTPSPIVYTTSQQQLFVVGVTDLSAYSEGSSGGGGSSAGGTGPVAMAQPAGNGNAAGKQNAPLLTPHGKGHASPTANGKNTGTTSASTSDQPLVPGQYPKTIGFDGISSAENTTANGYSLEPPDQGLCVGDQGGPNATVMEVINNSLQAFSPTGQPESQVIPTTQLFGVAAGDFLSDPRCYWDQNTRRWFFTEFDANEVSTQYIAVSQTDDALGKYTVFGLDTTDSNAPAGYGCPCFGDYDQIGADLNGFYISTNEFNDAGTIFSGANLYAMSKELLVDAADFQAPPPPAVRYAVTADQFGSPYHVSPSQTPPDGSYFPNTELFVESNSDANSDNHLLVYAMTNTKLLDSGGIPPLAASQLTSEAYSYPPNAPQNTAGSAPETTIDADFNAIQEVTETHGILYAELDSGGSTLNPATGIGTGPAEVDWFILDPEQNNPLSVQLLNQGVVSSPGNGLLYPDIAVAGNGDGYLIFSASGPNVYPSPGYVHFDKYAGPDGPLLMPTTGVDDENGFTCYPPYGVPGDPFNDCRWGDYSMGVAFDNRIFMATEYIPPPGVQNAYTNWGTYIWDTPFEK
jgi:hypothetical protein